MKCCQWKRSTNDALKDPETGKVYCGTCWQYYLQKRIPYVSDNKVRAESKPDGLQNVEGVSEENEALVADDDTLRPLESFAHADGQRYLISRPRRLVFKENRLPSGHFRCVGEVSGDGKGEVKLFKVTTIASITKFPFEAASEDHCETPQNAYEDIAPVLTFLADALGKSKESLRIWDPYYCAGSVKMRLGRLGFKNVRNDCVDFYRLVEDGKVPSHDVIVTNPPYSTSPVDHIEKLFRILGAMGTPWIVLQPNYVYTKCYWTEITCEKMKGPRPFFLTPTTPRRYKYRTPCGLRMLTHAQELNTSPFVTFWYCWFGAKWTSKFYSWMVDDDKGGWKTNLSLACTEYFLPDAFKDSNDRTRRKKRRPRDEGKKTLELRTESSDRYGIKSNGVGKKRKLESVHGAGSVELA